MPDKFANVEILYRLMGGLAALELPIVFKGAVVLRTVLENAGIVETARQTRDIDGDWVGEPPSMENLLLHISKVADGLDIQGIKVAVVREYAENRSAGFRVSVGAETLFTIDISIRPNPFGREYYTVTGVRFIGSSIEKIVADKVKTISSRLVFRRTKDIYDLYLLSALNVHELHAIAEVYHAQNVAIGEFTEFITDVSLVEHAYEQLAFISSKPTFETVYTRVSFFLQPFIDKSYTDVSATWSSEACRWICK